MSNSIKKLLCACLVLTLLALPVLVSADVYMKQKQHNDAYSIMGQEHPAEDVIQEVWMKKDKIATIGPNTSVIIRADKKVQYIIDHKKKTYTEISMDFSKMASGADKEAGQQMQDMMKNMMKDVKISVKPTGEKKKINNWNCKKYLQEIEMMMGPMTMEIWATEDIKIDETIFSHYLTGQFAAIPGMAQHMEKITKESKKIKGTYVLNQTTTNVMGSQIKTSVELLEFKDTKAPDSVFEIPKGYKKASMMGPGM